MYHQTAIGQCALLETTLPCGLETSGQRAYCLYWLIKRSLNFLRFQWFFVKQKIYLWLLSWWTSLLCIVGDLAGGGSVARAVGVGDRWHVAGDRWQVIDDMWQVTNDTSHMTHDMSCERWHMKIYNNVFLIFFFVIFSSSHILLVSVLLSAHIEKLSVSRMLDF